MSAPHAWPTARLWSLAPLPSHIHTHFSVILVALGRVCAWCVCMRHRGWCGPAGAVHDRPFHRALGQLWSLCGGVPVRHLRCPDQPAGASRHGEAKPCAMCCYPLRMLCSLQGSLGQGIMLPIVPLPIVPKSVRVHVRACVRACVRGTDATVLLLHLLHHRAARDQACGGGGGHGHGGATGCLAAGGCRRRGRGPAAVQAAAECGAATTVRRHFMRWLRLPTTVLQ